MASMSVVQSTKQAVSDVAGSVTDTAVSALSSSVKQIAKTPLDILEELLGGKPSPSTPEKPEPTEQGQQSTIDPSVLAAQQQQDESFKTTQQQQLHDQITQQSVSYYEQKKQMDEEKKQVDEQKKEQHKFEIAQLEKKKHEDFALQAAKDASSAEKRVGAG